jgi:hypothetical protein
MRIFFIAALTILFSLNLLAEDKFVIEGRILDKSNDKIIPGAGIRIANTNRGTYSSSKGKFRILVGKGDTLHIRSIGYSPISIVTKESQSNLDIKLEPMPVRKGNVDVTADITPEQIIERVIKNKNDNLKKLKTFSGELYSKLLLELGGTVLSASTTDNGFSVSSTISGGDKDVSDSRRYIIMETYSDVKKDYDKNINKTTILKRRQTANIPSDQNLMAITEFVSFYDDEINFLNTKIPSPIGVDALSSYNFKLKDRILQYDRYIYVIDVEPASEIYPRFEGEIRVIEGTYNITEIDLKPSATTFIPFFKDVSIKQQYSESTEKVWYPSFLDVAAKAKIEVLKGFIDFDADIKVTSIFSDAKINQPLPDSLYKNEIPQNLSRSFRRIEVAPLADTKDTIFWQQNSLRELSDKEVEIYSRVDSAVKSDSSFLKSGSREPKNFSFDVMPYLDFNRVSSVSLGLSPKAGIYGFELYGTGYFSFGLQDWYGNVGLKLPRYYLFGQKLELSTEIYSNQGVFGTSPGVYPRIINTVAAALVHEDYFDYYQKEGFSANLDIDNSYFKLNLQAEFDRQYFLDKNTDKSIFENYTWRENLRAWQGDYQAAKFQFTTGNVNLFSLREKFETELNINGFYGKEKNAGIEFNGISGRMIMSIPTFSTGYNPMSLLLSVSGGITSDNTPVQYQHRMATRLFLLNNIGNFYTAPLGVYGGNQYYSVQANYNLTDLWWRWLGLPTYEGRGVDLLIGGTWGVFENTTSSLYRPTGKDGYSEVGFGFSRIPTFVSNVIYWSLDWRFGIGPETAGRTGGAVTVSLPF